jgi:hypothetical protein
VAGTCEHDNDNSGSINENLLTSTEAVRFATTTLIQRFGQSVCRMWFLRALTKDLGQVLTYVGCGPG